MMDFVTLSRKQYFKQQKLETLFRLSLLVIGSLASLLLLTSLLQVDYSFPVSHTEIRHQPLSQTLPKALAHQAKEKESPLSFLSSIKKKTVIVERGDTVSSVLSKLNLDKLTQKQIEHLPQFYNYVHGLKVGEVLTSQFSGKKLKLLHLPLPHHQTLEVKQNSQGYTSYILVNDKIIKPALKTMTIQHSTYASAKQAGLPIKTIMAAMKIFGNNVNFKKEIKQGDKFTILYQQTFIQNKLVGSGDILAAKLQLKHKTLEAVRRPAYNGNAVFYTPSGQSLQLAFIRSPVKYTHISSPFNLHRIHPVLKIVRPHKGVDLAAKKGTPIHATSNGKIKFLGRMGGYGNMVEINHSGQRSTRYGHMSRFAKGLKQGSYVSRGQIIGYVGSTGVATGPHVHYELRVNKRPINPMTAKLPLASKISKQQLPRFLDYAKSVITELSTKG